MIRRIRRLYPVPVKITRDCGPFAGLWLSTIAEARPRNRLSCSAMPIPLFAMIWLKCRFGNGDGGEIGDEDLHGCGCHAGVDRGACASPDGGQAASGRRRQEDGSKEAASRRKGLQ